MNPTTPAVQPPAPVQPQPAKIQTKIVYKMGKGISLGEDTGLLEWSADDHIRLFKLDGRTDQVIELVFDILPTTIISVGGISTFLSLKTDTIFVRFVFSNGGAVAGESLLGYLLNKSAGIYAWTKQLKQYGVKLTYWTIIKTTVLSLIATGAIIVIVVVIALIGSLA